MNEFISRNGNIGEKCKEFIDDGVSGTNFDRPGWNKLQEEMEEGNIKVVITKNLSRLGRSNFECSYYLDYYFPHNNIRYIAIQEQIDTQNYENSNNEYAALNNFINEKYSRDLSKNLKKVYKMKQQAGEYMGGNNKLLYMMEPLEKEEAFFQYENGCMSRQKGFYLYYDKNEQMQEYMIEMGRNTPIEDKSLVKDKAVQDFRKIISGKPAKEEKEKGQFSLIHAIGVCVIVGAIAVGITYLNSYQKLEETSVKVKQTALRVKENTPGLEATTEAEILSNDEEQGESLAEQTEEALPEDTEGEPEGQAEDAAVQGQELVANGSYVVQKGDTLSNISKRVYGNDSQVKNICQLNNLRINDTIYPGQIILLP